MAESVKDCIDLRPWADGKRYRWRYEESYKAEKDAEVRGDGRWYVEVICQRGMIYPWGDDFLLAFTESSYAWRDLLALGVMRHQVGDTERVGKFPSALLPEVAKILKPRRKHPGPGAATLEARVKVLRHEAERRKSAQEPR